MRIVISGGGTGGHIYPALAFIKTAISEDANTQVLYIGTKKGLENKIVTRNHIPFETIDITGFKRKLSFENVKTIIRFIKGVHKSKKLLKQFNPDIVIGTGGYVCGPVVYAAYQLKIPSIIHEQNSIPGLTNKFLSKYVDKIAISFKEAEQYFPSDKVVLTGNPRATEVLGHDGIKGRQSAGLSLTKKTVLIFSGSREQGQLMKPSYRLSMILRLGTIKCFTLPGKSILNRLKRKLPMPEILIMLKLFHLYIICRKFLPVLI